MSLYWLKEKLLLLKVKKAVLFLIVKVLGSAILSLQKLFIKGLMRLLNKCNIDIMPLFKRF